MPAAPSSERSSRSEISAGREHVRTRGRELDRERQAAQAHADRLDGVRVRAGRREAEVDRTRTRDEELDRLVVVQRTDRQLLLGAHVQRLPARGDDLDARRRLQHLGERRGRDQHLLEVVEDEQQVLVAQVVRECSSGVRPGCSRSSSVSTIAATTASASVAPASATKKTPLG